MITVKGLKYLLTQQWWQYSPCHSLSSSTPIKLKGKDGVGKDVFFEYNPEQDILWIMEVEDDEQIDPRTD